MSYCISYDFSTKLDGEDYENISWNELSGDNDKIIETEQFDYFYEDYKDEKDEDETEQEHRLSLIETFECEQAYDELRDTFAPIMNFIHILQQEPMEEQVKLVEEYAGVCVLISVDKLGVNGIALTGGGMDLSDNIELAYYLTDGTSPIKSTQIMSLSKKAEALLMFCREEESVYHNKILEFLSNYKEEK